MKTDPSEENTSSGSHAEEIANPHEPDTADATVDRTANALEAMSVEAGEKMKMNTVETKTVTTDAPGRMTSNASEKIGEDMTIDVSQVKRNEQAKHVIDLMLPGGEMKKGVDPLEGAKLWMKQYYPNLDSQSVIIKSDYDDMPIPMLDETTCDNLISKKESQNKDDGVAKYLKAMKNNMRGIRTELEVTDMLPRFLEMTKPVVIITQYQFRRFSKLFCPEKEMEQEIDDVIILGEYAKVVLLEIKSSGSFSKSMTNSLDRKKEI